MSDLSILTHAYPKPSIRKAIMKLPGYTRQISPSNPFNRTRSTRMVSPTCKFRSVRFTCDSRMLEYKFQIYNFRVSIIHFYLIYGNPKIKKSSVYATGLHQTGIITPHVSGFRQFATSRKHKRIVDAILITQVAFLSIESPQCVVISSYPFIQRHPILTAITVSQ